MQLIERAASFSIRIAHRQAAGMASQVVTASWRDGTVVAGEKWVWISRVMDAKMRSAWRARRVVVAPE